MPLSEEELRLLEQMERALTEEDPKFASTLRGTTLRRTVRRHAILAGLGVVVGVGVLMTGVITGYWQVGIVGFVIMLAATTLGFSVVRGHRVGGGTPFDQSPAGRTHHSGFAVIDGGRHPGRRSRHHHPAGGAASHPFMDRLRVRWRRRRDSGGW